MNPHEARNSTISVWYRYLEILHEVETNARLVSGGRSAKSMALAFPPVHSFRCTNLLMALRSAARETDQIQQQSPIE